MDTGDDASRAQSYSCVCLKIFCHIKCGHTAAAFIAKVNNCNITPEIISFSFHSPVKLCYWYILYDTFSDTTIKFSDLMKARTIASETRHSCPGKTIHLRITI